MRRLFSPEPGSGIPALLRAGVLAGGGSETYSGSVVTFTAKRAAPVKSLTAAIEPVQSGSGDPSPENVRPISGWDAATVTRTGKNLWNLGDIAETRKKEGSFSLDSGTYTLSAVVTSEATDTNSRAVFWDSDMQMIASVVIPHDGIRHSVGLVIDRPVARYELWAGGSSSASTGMAFTFADVQIEIGSTATAYAPYTGQTYPISLGRTVYGGSLDVTTGVLTVDRAMVDATTLIWSKSALQTNPKGTYFYANDTVPFIGWASGGINTALSNALTKASVLGNNLSENVNTFWWNDARTGYRCIWGAPNGESTLAEFTEFLQQNSVVFVGKLETPQTYQLTPQEVTTLLGDNCIWADTGDIIVIV